MTIEVCPQCLGGGYNYVPAQIWVSDEECLSLGVQRHICSPCGGSGVVLK